ncbi:MAG TPA: molybdopterin molybdotransferase MoeA [Nitrospirae bacterium]|nr:molybdopterin molybdotransferase MoeA [Nitrospirota bacterium]
MFDKDYKKPEEALKLILKSIGDLTKDSETIPIEEAYQRILAEDIHSSEDLPGFDRCTVDGYALIATDTFGAKDTNPVYLEAIGEVFMGEETNLRVNRGQCVKIPTGGMLPDGADAVIMFEHTQQISENLIEVLRSLSVGENVISRDEDIKKGELILKKGSQLRSQDIGAFAGLGITNISVFKKPIVSIISTGDEIVPASSPIKIGQVRDINSYSLDGLIRQRGGITKKIGIIKDNYDEIKRAFSYALSISDIVLISGGTSAGVKDMTSRIINDTGKPGVLFHGVAMKPGKPLIAGLVDSKPVFGLPGHPSAIFVSFDKFIRPVIENIAGYKSTKNIDRTIKASISKSIASSMGREDHIRVSLEKKSDGTYLAHPIFGKSGLITTLVSADGIVIIDEDSLGLDAGDEVTVRLF